ncbi:MAG: Smr/MutS family protein, partial [Muribaculaceae bacterium]|nr:Smr/MutS family protein [Muribaculaceae bacterium]
IEDIIARYESEMETLRNKRREIISEAREQAREILDGSNATIERTIREIRTAQAEKERTREARKRLASEREALKDRADKAEAHPMLDKKIKSKRSNAAPAPKPAQDRPLEPGDNVVLDGAGTVGTIKEISGKEAIVIFGQMKTTVKLSRLKRTLKKAPTGATASPSYISAQTADSTRERQLSFSHEIDVRGMRADEAVQAIMYYIDDAIQFNSSRVRILHGTGTGALRQYIRRYLDTVNAVSNYHDEDVRFGGPGITVVEFD